MSRNQKCRREWLSQVFMLLVSSVIAIVVMELAVRIFLPQSDRFVQYDPIMGWKHPANREGYWRKETMHPVRIRINAHSLRGPEIDFHKAPNQFRILMLGDSFTEAFQVEEAESHSAVLERLLSGSDSQRTFQVINAGVGGYSTGQELLYFQQWGKKYSPDLVVLNVCTNDISDEADHFSGIRPIFQLTNDSLQLVPPAPKSFWMLWLRDHLLMNMHLASLIRDRAARLGPATSEFFHQMGLGRFGRKSLSGSKSIDSQNLQRTLLLIKTLQRESDAIDAKLIVFMIPPGGLVHRTPLAKPVASGNSEKCWLEELAERLRSEHVEVIESLDQFKEQAAAGQKLYVNYNGHWTAAGHALAAKILYDHITKNLLPQQNLSGLNKNLLTEKEISLNKI